MIPGNHGNVESAQLGVGPGFKAEVEPVALEIDLALGRGVARERIGLLGPEVAQAATGAADVHAGAEAAAFAGDHEHAGRAVHAQPGQHVVHLSEQRKGERVELLGAVQLKPDDPAVLALALDGDGFVGHAASPVGLVASGFWATHRW